MRCHISRQCPLRRRQLTLPRKLCNTCHTMNGSGTSVLSSVLTLTSNTTGSTGSSPPHQKINDVGTSYIVQFKKLYHDPSLCEAKLSKDI